MRPLQFWESYSRAKTLRSCRSTAPAGMKRRSRPTSFACEPTGLRNQYGNSMACAISSATPRGSGAAWKLAQSQGFLALKARGLNTLSNDRDHGVDERTHREQAGPAQAL